MQNTQNKAKPLYPLIYDVIKAEFGTEEWRPIPGYEGLYAISNLGQVKSLKREKLLKPNIDKDGYHYFGLSKKGLPKTFKAHKLVMHVFVGSSPNHLPIVCHNNGCADDNRLCNLRYDTQAGNLSDQVTHGTSTQGEGNGFSKLTDDDVREIHKLLASETLSQTQIGRMFGVSSNRISQIKRGKAWVHIPSISCT